ATIEDAFEGALASDPVSAYGGVVAVNRPVTDALAARLAEHFVEVLSAPEYELEALEALQAKASVRILRGGSAPAGQHVRSALGGLLLQECDAGGASRA